MGLKGLDRHQESEGQDDGDVEKARHDSRRQEGGLGLAAEKRDWVRHGVGNRRFPLFRHVGEESQSPRPLDAYRQHALVLGAGAGDPSRKDLPALGDEAAHAIDILVIDFDFLGAEFADLLLEETFAAAGAARAAILSVFPGFGAVPVLAGGP